MILDSVHVPAKMENRIDYMITSTDWPDWFLKDCVWSDTLILALKEYEKNNEYSKKGECKDMNEWRDDDIFIKNVIFSGNITTVVWSDGTKTQSKPLEGDEFSPKIGLALAIAEKLFGSKTQFGKYVDFYMNRSIVAEMKGGKKQVKNFYVWDSSTPFKSVYLHPSKNIVSACKASDAAQTFADKISISSGETLILNVVSKDFVDKMERKYNLVYENIEAIVAKATCSFEYKK